MKIFPSYFTLLYFTFTLFIYVFTEEKKEKHIGGEGFAFRFNDIHRG
jgi:hypothetical protein